MEAATPARQPLATAVHGDAGPWLTLIHGGLVPSVTWRHAAATLSSWARVVTLDLRGYGSSPGGGERHLVADHAADVVDAWDRLGIERSHVVGFSIGGMIAQEATLIAPDRVDRLALVSTACAAKAEAREHLLARADAVERDPGGAPVAEHVGLAFSPEFVDEQPEVVDRYRALALRADRAVVAQTLRAVAEFDRRDAIGAIASRTLVVAGGRDAALGPDHAREIASRIPAASLVLLEALGHTIHVEAPSTFTYLMADFLDHGGMDD